MAISSIFCRVPGGMYQVGVPAEEMEILLSQGFSFYTNKGSRVVYIRPFRIRTHPVSVREYIEFVRITQAKFGEWETHQRGLDTPVTGVSHHWAKRFARWAGGRLPTAFEWEAAARGKNGRPFPWGFEHRDDVVPNVEMPQIGSRPELESPFGVQELIGWVSEWTSDLIDGRAIVKGSPYHASKYHLADEAAYQPESQGATVGFRYVLSD